jgi:hypothetical protein
MATITIGHIIENLIQVTLNDVDTDHWSQETLLDWSNQGQREIVSLAPQAYSVIVSILLTSGAKQTIPTGGIAFIRAIRNMGTDGTTPGNSITMTVMESLAAFLPSWSSETATAVVYNAMPDPQNPEIYYIYPPSDGTNYAEIEHSKVPTTIPYDAEGAWKASKPSIRDNCLDALVDYILYRAFTENIGGLGMEQKAMNHRNAFLQSLGVQTQQQ